MRPAGIRGGVLSLPILPAGGWSARRRVDDRFARILPVHRRDACTICVVAACDTAVLCSLRIADYVLAREGSGHHRCDGRHARPAGYGPARRSHLDERCGSLGPDHRWPASASRGAHLSAGWHSRPVPAPDAAAGEAARARQEQLTKPPGSLGRLEDLACWFAARLRNPVPVMPPCEIFVFASDQGVAARGVSAFRKRSPLAVQRGARLLIAGDMGIANTTAHCERCSSSL